MNVFTSALNPPSAVIDLEPKTPMSLHLPIGSAVYAVNGTLWVTQEGLSKDIVLNAGDGFDVRQRGLVVISAMGGPAVVHFAPANRPHELGAIATSPDLIRAVHARAHAMRAAELRRLGVSARRFVVRLLRRVQTWLGRRALLASNSRARLR